MDGFVLDEKLSFKMLGLSFSLNWIGALTLTIAYTAPKKLYF